MRLLMPQAFRKNKLKVYKSFSLIDFFVGLSLAGLVFAIAGPLPLEGFWKLLIFVLLAIPIAYLMIFNAKHNCRNYIFIVRAFRFKSYNKKYVKKREDKLPANLSPKELKKIKKVLKKRFFTDDLVAIKNISYSKRNQTMAVVKTKALKLGHVGYWTAFKVTGLDITNYSSDEKEKAYDAFTNILKFVQFRISIIKISKYYDLSQNEAYIEQKIADLNATHNSKNKATEAVYVSYLHSLDDFKSSNWENNYYIVVYADKIENLLTQCRDLQDWLEAEKFWCSNLSKSEIVQLQIDILDHKNSNKIFDTMFQPILDPETNEIEARALTIDDFLAFETIEFSKKHFTINNSLHLNVQTLSKYPLTINYHWIETLFNTPSSVVMHLDPINWKDARSQIHKTHLNLKTNALESGANVVDQIDLNKTQEALNLLADAIATGEELLKRFQIFFVNSAHTKETLEEIKKINETNASYINATISPLTFLQFEAFQNIILKPTDNLNWYQECTDSTLSGGWPFATNDFNDGNDFVLGAANDGSVVIFDQFVTNSARTNYNMMILGTSGKGKSSLTKKIAMHHLANDQQNIIIDPESEYKGLLTRYGGYFEGSYYALGGDAKTKFNPLQIQSQFTANEDEQTIDDQNDEEKLEELIEDNQVIIYKHISWFGNWMKILFPELSDPQIRYLEASLKELYKVKYSPEFLKNHRISWLKPTEYPIMSDLINHIEANNPEDSTKWLILEILKHHFGEGLLGTIYDGYSNVELDDQLIIFDVQALFTDETAKTGRAALNIIINSINNQLIINYHKNRQGKKQILLTIDEAHLLLDPDNPETLKFLTRTVKRIRKYNGGVILTTQNPGDFADGAHSKKLTNILNNIQYSFFLGMKSEDIKAVSELYRASGGLTAYEQKQLARLPQGVCLFNPMPNFRKFITLHYNELEKRVSWKDYIPNSSDLNQTEKAEELFEDEIEANPKEVEVALPAALKWIYTLSNKFKVKFGNKNQSPDKPKVKTKDIEIKPEVNVKKEVEEKETDVHIENQVALPGALKWIYTLSNKIKAKLQKTKKQPDQNSDQADLEEIKKAQELEEQTELIDESINVNVNDSERPEGEPEKNE